MVVSPLNVSFIILSAKSSREWGREREQAVLAILTSDSRYGVTHAVAHGMQVGSGYRGDCKEWKKAVESSGGGLDREPGETSRVTSIYSQLSVAMAMELAITEGQISL